MTRAMKDPHAGQDGGSPKETPGPGAGIDVQPLYETYRTIGPLDLTTREFCGRCHRVSPVGFSALDYIWEAVAGRHWQHSILCIMCFAQLGDEKHIQWERGIEFWPVSYSTHHAGRYDDHRSTPMERFGSPPQQEER